MRSSITGSLAITCLALILSVAYLLEERREYKRLSEKHFKSSANYSGMLASCLNGRPLYDKLSGHALFTEKAISVDVTPIGK